MLKDVQSNVHGVVKASELVGQTIYVMHVYFTYTYLLFGKSLSLALATI